MKFLDEAKIFIKSGAGGNGCMSFRRERNIPKGGPDGGNGGKGGDVTFIGTNTLNTLIDFRFTQHYKAKRGIDGGGRNMHGANSNGIIVKVPLGTEVIDFETGTVLQDITEEGQTFLILTGGKGGRGNTTFATSINRTPRQTTDGQPAQEMDITLRLKLLADVGLVGLPNAGKSTFISSVSNAKPKIADYPFTTLHPALGVVRQHKTDMLLADLPGLIAGAGQGKGLGHQFLKHVSRCAARLHLIDGTATTEEVVGAYKTIRNELSVYDELFTDTNVVSGNISDLPEVLAISKCDSITEEDMAEKKSALEEASGVKVYLISSQSKQGLPEILNALAKIVEAKRAEDVME